MAQLMSPTAKIFYDRLLASGLDWRSASDLGFRYMIVRVANELLSKGLIEQSGREGIPEWDGSIHKMDPNYDHTKSYAANLALKIKDRNALYNIYRIVPSKIPAPEDAKIKEQKTKTRDAKISKAISFLEEYGYTVSKK